MEDLIMATTLIENSKEELVICLNDNIDGLPETEELEIIKKMISKIEETQYTSWVDLMKDQDEVYKIVNKAWFDAIDNKRNSLIQKWSNGVF